MLLVLLSVVLTYKQLVVGLEPECHCSRLHYEEKTLEKMIQTEIFVDKMKTEIEIRQNEMAKVVEEMKSELESSQNKMNEKVEKIQNDYDEAKLELELLRHNISGVAVSLEVFSTKKAIAESVAFLARDVNKAALSAGETLVFTAIELNEGNGYDSTTGIFTAPVSGVYMFSLQLCLSDLKVFYWKIMADNRRILAGCFVDESSSYYGCNSASGVAVISAQNKIYVKIVKSTGGDHIKTRRSDGNIWNYFSGTLINHQ